VAGRKFAVADAEAFYTLLIFTTGRFKKDSVMLLTIAASASRRCAHQVRARGHFSGPIGANVTTWSSSTWPRQGAPEVTSRLHGLGARWLQRFCDAHVRPTARPSVQHGRSLSGELQPIFIRIPGPAE